MERKKLLETLYSAIQSKSKVCVDTTVSRIEQQPQDSGRVRVHTTEGNVYEADLVVGADGVHSAARAELWETANWMRPDMITTKEKSCT